MNSPRLLKGAIGVVDPSSRQTKVVYIIMFQYNPAKVRRTLTTQRKTGKKETEILQVGNFPEETIDLSEVVIDIVDHPENAKTGIYPLISALELLLYPESKNVTKLAKDAEKGRIEIKDLSQEVPSTLFIWGENRVVPVEITNLTINEEIYDSNLNPVHANVSLTMKVLNYGDFPIEHPNFENFLTYHQKKEKLASSSTQKESVSNHNSF